MKYDNLTIRQKVLECLKTNYRLSIDSVAFIPVGEESYCYLIVDRSQNKFFAKYCTKTDIIKNIDLVNELLLQLKHYDFVVPPIRVGKDTSFSILGGKVCLYPYIEGKVVNIGNDRFDQKLVSRLLDIILKIHSSTNVVKVDLPREDFNNDFLKELELLIKLAKSKDIDLDVKNLLKSNEGLIRKVIEQHTLLGEKYKNVKLDFVLTHGDITGLNIIISDNNLKLVDWDGAMFAPAERDINFFSDNPYFSIDEYLKRMNKNQYDPQLRKYYGQQWSLGSIIGNFETLISTKKMTEADKGRCIQEINQYLSYYK